MCFGSDPQNSLPKTSGIDRSERFEVLLVIRPFSSVGKEAIQSVPADPAELPFPPDITFVWLVEASGDFCRPVGLPSPKVLETDF